MSEVTIDIDYICNLAGYHRDNMGNLHLPVNQKVVDEIRRITRQHTNELTSELQDKLSITAIMVGSTYNAIFQLVVFNCLVGRVGQIIIRSPYCEDIALMP